MPDMERICLGWKYNAWYENNISGMERIQHTLEENAWHGMTILSMQSLREIYNLLLMVLQ